MNMLDSKHLSRRVEEGKTCARSLAPRPARTLCQLGSRKDEDLRLWLRSREADVDILVSGSKCAGQQHVA